MHDGNGHYGLQRADTSAAILGDAPRIDFLLPRLLLRVCSMSIEIGEGLVMVSKSDGSAALSSCEDNVGMENLNDTGLPSAFLEVLVGDMHLDLRGPWASWWGPVKVLVVDALGPSRSMVVLFVSCSRVAARIL